MLNFLNEIDAPLAVVVDGYACSAATPVLIAAPYRVMHEAAFVMVHEGSISVERAKDNNARFIVNDYMGSIMAEYASVYAENTQIPKKMLADMLARDKFMDAAMCKRWSVVDRVLKIDKAPATARWEKYTKLNPESVVHPGSLPRGDNLNHLFVYDNEIEKPAPPQLPSFAGGVMRLVRPLQAVLESPSKGVAGPLVLHTNLYMTPQAKWFDIATLIIRVNLLPVPIYGIIDSNVDIVQAIPCIMSHKRYMYSNTKIFVRLIQQHEDVHMQYYDDMKHNTELLRAGLRRILSQYTKLTRDMLDKLFNDRMMLSPQDCLKYGLIDEIIAAPGRGVTRPVVRRLRPSPPQSGGCMCSQNMSYNNLGT
jgi:ATP-dependent protease ClpP protease subunit